MLLSSSLTFLMNLSAKVVKHLSALSGTRESSCQGGDGALPTALRLGGYMAYFI